MRVYLQKCIGVFRVRFVNGLQYRAAALAGMVTQVAWGFMEILLFRAFYEADPASFPMGFDQLASYIWLKEAFITGLAIWYYDNDIFALITDGNLAYELVRPIHIYDFWFMKNAGMRLSRVILRSVLVLGVAALLPQPWGLNPPASLGGLALFIVSLALGLTVATGIVMLVYITSIHTTSSQGIRQIMGGVGELLTGSIIPLPFFPPALQRIAELLPFGSCENVPFRIYSGHIAGEELAVALLLQAFWAVALIAGGRLWLNASMKRVTVQGG